MARINGFNERNDNTLGEFIVYKYTNLVNGLIYIGITSKGLKKRWQSGYKGNERLSNDIRLYGEANFKKEILYENLSQEEASELEIKTIKELNARDPNIGYNISIGGTSPMYGRNHTEKSKKKMSEQRKGENNAFYGKHHDRFNMPQSIPIVCLNTLEIFPSFTYAGEQKTQDGWTGCSEKNISRAIIDPNQLSAGKDLNGNPVFWSIYDKNLSKEYYQDLYTQKAQEKEERMYYLRTKYPVIDILSKKIYDSAKEAEKQTGIYYSDITQCCNGSKSTCGNTIFLYLSDYEKLTDKEILNIIVQRWTKRYDNRIVEPIVCLNNNKLYPNSISANKISDCKYSDMIGECARKERPYGGERANGEYLRWAYYSDYLKMTKDEIQQIINTPILNHTPVICLTTDKRFRDANSGATYYGLHRTGIKNCCEGKYKTSGTFNGQKLEWVYDSEYHWDEYETSQEILDKINNEPGLLLPYKN